ncbi:SDR family NAD(P)-dependent oxidoreductase [Marinifilum caeruleilacunae]|uniref:SDR family oxidoreductase n=1 Tax=Marinifilum caeruleilacunae TaxID=2499076 RepID=A0ABX1WR90_9BACT|nr:SDR family oxidoreductase [Marinifilum caeruleilacunae]NOU58531.1 SDR family oxidoreductase [Marinifilum caeruleilacunae]
MKKVALITGASAGIGTELAKIHAEKGGDLVIVARRKDKLEELKKELEEMYGVQVYTIAKDLSKSEAALELYDEVKKQGIEVEYLLNNAGFGGQGKFHERKWEDDLAMIQLNIVTLTALTRFFLDDMLKRNKGKILNVSSTASFAPGPLQAVYFATKAFVTFFSNAISNELNDTNITVTALLPGATETEFAKVSGMDKSIGFQQTVSARSVAEDGYKGMMKGKMDVISGLTFMQKLMLSFIPITPKKLILEQMRKFNAVN